MVFSSLIFLYAFLPAVLLVYFLAPGRVKNTVLLLSSLVFYAWSELRYLPLILCTIATGYGAGLAIGRFRRHGKVILVLEAVLCLGSLGLFKYANLLLEALGGVFRLELPLWRLALPLGISFYTFQILSYAVDVYRGTVEPQKNPIDFGVYVVFFPQLIAGPIVRYQELAPQLKSRRSTLDGAYEGAVRFLTGLGKKVLLANPLGAICSAYGESTAPTVLFSWLSALAFTLQIYFDFSGYSDMAVGLGRIFGFQLPENFRHPYMSSSVTAFWRRWHITLGAWFRDYVYIPMGGNRVSRARWIRNILVVGCLTGLWHGAGWNFLLWGLFFALLLLGEKLWYGSFLERHRVFAHGYVLLALVLSFVMFQGPTVEQALSNLKAMFFLGELPLWNRESLYYLRGSLVLLLLGIMGATPLPSRVYRRLEPVLSWVQPVGLVLLLLVCTAYLVDGSFNPFLYFRF